MCTVAICTCMTSGWAPAWLWLWLNQAGPCRASKATQAQSRAKQLEKLKEAAIPLPAASSGAGPGDAKKVMLRLPKAPACDEVVLQLEVGPHFHCNLPEYWEAAEMAAWYVSSTLSLEAIYKVLQLQNSSSM